MNKLDNFNDFISEAASYDDIKLLKKAWTKYLESFSQMKDNLSNVKNLLKSISRNAPTVAQRTTAERLYDSVDGNLDFVLRRNRDSSIQRYSDSTNENLQELFDLPSKEEKVRVAQLPDPVTRYISANDIIQIKRVLLARKITNGYFGGTLSGTYLMQNGSGETVPREFYLLKSLMKSGLDPKIMKKFKSIFLKATGYQVDMDTYGNITFKK